MPTVLGKRRKFSQMARRNGECLDNAAALQDCDGTASSAHLNGDGNVTMTFRSGQALLSEVRHASSMVSGSGEDCLRRGY